MLDVTDDTKLDAPSTPKTRNARGRSRTHHAPESERPARTQGLKISRHLSTEGTSPFDELEWERRQASIGDDKGNTIFCQNDVEVPKGWSMLATNVVSSKYFYGALGHFISPLHVLVRLNR